MAATGRTCILPGCTKPVMMEDGEEYDYCSMAHLMSSMSSMSKLGSVRGSASPKPADPLPAAAPSEPPVAKPDPFRKPMPGPSPYVPPAANVASISPTDLKAFEHAHTPKPKAVPTPKPALSPKEVEYIKAKTAERKKDIQQVMINIKDSQQIYICFVMDCTGSMQGQINAVKDSVLLFVQKLSTQYAHLKLHFGFVRYTDYDMPAESRTTFLQFTTNAETFKKFIAGIKAEGGGDGPEDVFGGLAVALKEMDWGSTANSNLLIHIADAPCHGSQYHDMKDSYPDGDPAKIPLSSLMSRIHRFNINYWFGKMDKCTDKMIEAFNKALMEAGSSNPIQVFESLEKAEVIAQAVTQATLATVTSSMASKGPKAMVRPYATKSAEPDWRKIKLFTAKQVTFRLPSYDDILSPAGAFSMEEATIYVKIAPLPFAAGGVRLAYHGRQYTSSAMDESTAKHVVFKVMKHVGPDHGRTKHYIQELEVTTVAAKLALDYQAELQSRRLRIDTPFGYGVAKVVTFETDPIDDNGVAPALPKEMQTVVRARTVFNMETFIGGSYEKFNSNAGYVADTPLGLEFGAFSHWTFAKTDEQLMIVDLQGVSTDRGVILSDPAIHSLQYHRYGKTNHGANGFDLFFGTHKCTARCRELGLVPPTMFK